MKPVAIFRHAPEDGPGRLSHFLEGRGIPAQVIEIDQGQSVPADPTQFSGLAFMGGPMSVNDPLPWVDQEVALIRAADARQVPVIGHCLGGQLMAKAFGAVVTRNRVKEIGWGRVSVSDDAAAAEWFGWRGDFLSFHWHGETFGLPPGTSRVLSSAYCENQGFVRGIHIGFQCHVEMTEDMIRGWCRSGAGEIAANAGPSVQTTEAMLSAMSDNLAELNAVADGIYERWIRALAA